MRKTTDRAPLGVKAPLLRVSVQLERARQALNRRAILALLAVVTPLLPAQSQADEDIADMVSNVATGASTSQTGFLTIMLMVGVVLVGVSLFGYSRIGKAQGVTAGRCTIGLLVGASLAALGAILNRTQSQVGLSSTTIS